MTMRLCWQAFAAAIILFATPTAAGPFPGSRPAEMVRNPEQGPPVFSVANETTQETDKDTVAFMAGKCSILKVAGQNFTCRSLVYFHGEQGRANYTIVLDDPTDDRNMISFSGENGRRDQDDLYELPVDQVLLNSKHRPKVDGLRVPLVEFSTGKCKQIGNFAANQVSNITCSATDKNNKKYELQCTLSP